MRIEYFKKISRITYLVFSPKIIDPFMSLITIRCRWYGSCRDHRKILARFLFLVIFILWFCCFTYGATLFFLHLLLFKWFQPFLAAYCLQQYVHSNFVLQLFAMRPFCHFFLRSSLSVATSSCEHSLTINVFSCFSSSSWKFFSVTDCAIPLKSFFLTFAWPLLLLQSL